MDILNCMGFSIALLSVMALFRTTERIRLCAILGLAIALAAPLVSQMDWSGVPWMIRAYIVPDYRFFGFFPDRKGKVESGVNHAQRALQGKRFESLEEAQAYLDRWEASCADTRIHGTTKRQVAAMFAEEKPTLLPLPLEPFRYYQHGKRGVNLDGCVEVAAAYYGLPPGWIGREVNVQWDELFVRILDPQNGLLLREHVRQKRGWYGIKKEDHPRHMPLQVSQLLWRAGRAGSHIGTLCNLIYTQLGEVGIRRILGVLSLAKKFGTAAVQDACAAALEIGVHEYRFVRRYLERAPQLTLRQVDPLIRELVHYRDLINLRTQEPEDEPH